MPSNITLQRTPTNSYHLHVATPHTHLQIPPTHCLTLTHDPTSSLTSPTNSFVCPYFCTIKQSPLYLLQVYFFLVVYYSPPLQLEPCPQGSCICCSDSCSLIPSTSHDSLFSIKKTWGVQHLCPSVYCSLQLIQRPFSRFLCISSQDSFFTG